MNLSSIIRSSFLVGLTSLVIGCGDEKVVTPKKIELAPINEASSNYGTPLIFYLRADKFKYNGGDTAIIHTELINPTDSFVLFESGGNPAFVVTMHDKNDSLINSTCKDPITGGVGVYIPPHDTIFNPLEVYGGSSVPNHPDFKWDLTDWNNHLLDTGKYEIRFGPEVVVPIELIE